MKESIDPNDRRFLERLHRLGSATVQELCDDLGVTATAVRQRLSRLQASELIDREIVRTGRGRPHHTYRVTEAGLRELGDNYAELAKILWQEMRSIEDPAVRAHILERVQNALVKSYGRLVQGDSLLRRVEQLREALADRGFDVEVDTSGELPILREHNCPYLELATADPGICEMEQAVFQRILGVSVTLTQCCLEGHNCCEFQATAETSP